MTKVCQNLIAFLADNSLLEARMGIDQYEKIFQFDNQVRLPSADSIPTPPLPLPYPPLLLDLSSPPPPPSPPPLSPPPPKIIRAI